MQNAQDPRCRTGGSLDPTPVNSSQFNEPAGFDSDNLTDNELSFKTEWFNHRRVFNVSGYIMKWNEVQIALFDPTQDEPCAMAGHETSRTPLGRTSAFPRR